MNRDSPSPGLPSEEFKALRATIRERGHLRLFVSALTFVAWGALLIGGPLLTWPATSALIPLVVLVGGFEVVFATHVGVERIGRYLATHYEVSEGALPAWEKTAERLGRNPQSATGIDPLFARVFAIATLVNLMPLGRVDWHSSLVTFGGAALVVAAHVGFIARLIGASRFSRGQRQRDSALFEQTGL